MKMEKYRYNLNNEVGFTLIEQIISLAVLAILISLITPMAFKRIDDMTEQQFIKRLSNDILYTQNMALTYPEEYPRLRFHEDSYVIRVGIMDNFRVKREIPSHWKIQTGSLEEISFTKAGTIRWSGAIKIITPSTSHELIFALGKGREYIVNE